MAERNLIPNSPACGQWEILLADALDGLLKPEDEAGFTAHMAVCPDCAALFEEARRGCEWLEFLAQEPEVPSGLLDRILAQTGPGHAIGYGLAAGNGYVLPMPAVLIPAWQRPGLVSQVRRYAAPRLMMTAAMAFFSIAMTLNMTGVRLSSLRISDLRPSAIRSLMERRLTMASTPIIRYYDHSRLVYEVRTTVRELRRTTQGEVQGEGEDNRQKTQDLTPGESKQPPVHEDAIPRIDPMRQAGSPVIDDFDELESFLIFQQRPARSGSSQTETRERSTVWTA
ncbi:MAG: zf-HC2 domain-containing protein [Terracidiphilus sp.]|jgi:hypothetical protein